MTALKCDRCNGYFDYNSDTENFIAFGHKHIDTGRTFPVKYIDICPNCMEQFHKWFENPDSWKPEDCLVNADNDNKRVDNLCKELLQHRILAPEED
jgi:hypothetical protein